jgi:hypothetical protein
VELVSNIRVPGCLLPDPYKKQGSTNGGGGASIYNMFNRFRPVHHKDEGSAQAPDAPWHNTQEDTNAQGNGQHTHTQKTDPNIQNVQPLAIIRELQHQDLYSSRIHINR